MDEILKITDKHDNEFVRTRFWSFVRQPQAATAVAQHG